ncbi:helix-turn-helix domain-containing protein [Kitasatospora sp. NPDC004799]|uniref:helix-turn-helix domain-containing protein n=1 Tax=Kitasatospora sp. NPDC004799 TaxID=3154460 RepID=UPI0033BCE475
MEPEAGPVERFAGELRALRRAAGGPVYRAMAARAHVSPSALSAAASGDRLPTLTVTLAHVRACGGDEVVWEARWHAAARLSGRAPGPVPAPGPSAGPARPVPRPPGRVWGLAATALGTAAAVLRSAGHPGRRA